MYRILGLDVGDKTIGVAVSDLLHLTAQGVTTIRRTNEKEDLEELGKLIDNYRPEEIVVGLPKNMNGSIGFQGEKTQEFAEKIYKKFNIEIIFEDERLTTMAAEKMLISGDVSRKKRKTIIDKVAATYILQTYLDRKGRV